MKMFFAILIFLMIASCQTQIPANGPCRIIRRLPNFEPTKLTGQWYILATATVGKPIGMCGSVYFTADNKNATRLTEVQKTVLPGLPQVLEIIIKPEYIGDGMFVVRNSNVPTFINATVTYWNTDYTSYAIRANCRNFGQSSLYTGSIITRSRHPSPSVIAKINEALKIDGVPMEGFVGQNQTGCPQT